jgi:hypothetical protein
MIYVEQPVALEFGHAELENRLPDELGGGYNSIHSGASAVSSGKCRVVSHTVPRRGADMRARLPVRIRTIIVATVLGITSLVVGGAEAAGRIVVGHDINTLATFLAGTNEETFAVNVAGFLTSDSATKNLLLFESNPGDGTRDFAAGVLTALMSAGFSVTVTTDYTTPYTSYDAIFVAEDYQTLGFLDNDALTAYVNGGGGVYLAGGVGNVASTEAAGWSTFLGNFGLAFASYYNGIYTPVPITSSHPIFNGVTSLAAGNGQFISDLGTNPNAQIVQLFDDNGVYAVVDCSGSADACVPSSCAPSPATGCHLAAARKSSITIVDNADSAKQQFKWKWKAAATDVTTIGEFRDPAHGTPTLRACVYDASGNLQPLMQAQILPGGTCVGKPCWKVLSVVHHKVVAATGYQYTNKAATPDGLTAATLKAGAAGKAQVSLTGKGSRLPNPPLGLSVPVTVQLLIGDGTGTACWQTTYATAQRNAAGQFKAKSE